MVARRHTGYLEPLSDQEVRPIAIGARHMSMFIPLALCSSAHLSDVLPSAVDSAPQHPWAPGRASDGSTRGMEAVSSYTRWNAIRSGGAGGHGSAPRPRPRHPRSAKDVPLTEPDLGDGPETSTSRPSNCGRPTVRFRRRDPPVYSLECPHDPDDGDQSYFGPASWSPVGSLTIFPSGAAKPLASDLNYAAGEIRPNLVVVRLGGEGKVALYTPTATTWYSTWPAGSRRPSGEHVTNPAGAVEHKFLLRSFRPFHYCPNRSSERMAVGATTGVRAVRVGAGANRVAVANASRRAAR